MTDSNDDRAQRHRERMARKKAVVDDRIARAACPERVELADTVSQHREIKHAFKAGIKSQRGVEL